MANSLKLVANSAYGAMLNKYNAMYDPLMARSVCITGQLLMTDLVMGLRHKCKSFTAINFNTDGILFSIFEDELPKAYEVYEEWQTRTELNLEEDIVVGVWQKDINNLIVKFANGKVKVKGGYVSNYQGGDYKNASIPIVAKAIVEYLLTGVTVEDTINHSTNILDFQFIAKCGRTYDYAVWRINDELYKVQRVNRVYACADPACGTIYKVKEEENRKDKIANLPDHCVIDNDNQLTLDDIDKTFYIAMAKKRIEDFIGDNPNYTFEKKDKQMKLDIDELPSLSDTSVVRYFYFPEADSYWSLPVGEVYVGGTMEVELSFQVSKEVYDLGVETGKEPHELQTTRKKESIMTSKLTEPVQDKKGLPSAPKTFLDRLFDLRKEMSSYVWEKDGKNIAQKYKYITEAQYKKYFEKALEAVELDYFCNVDSVEFIRNLSESNNGNVSHMTQIKATYSIIDPRSGDKRDYVSWGQGTDSGDKGIYKAITGALKYFISNNFLIAENNDPENDDEDTKPKSNRPAEPAKRAEIKKELMSNDEPATPDQKKLIKTYRDQLKAAGDHDEAVKHINAVMKASPTKVQAGALIMDLEELVEELGDSNG